MSKILDYAIVGQGIAGSIMALQLKQKNKSFILFDSGFKKSSSYVAAGIMNPLVLKRLTKTWRANEFLQYNQTFYPSLNRKLGKTYYHPLELKKLIYSESEFHFWKTKIQEGEINDYIGSTLEKLLPEYDFQKPFFTGQVKNCAWLDLKKFLPDVRIHLKENKQLVEESFQFSLLNNKAGYFSYNEHQFKKIIFCEGANLIHNPYFKHLPMGLNKGELVQLKIPDLKKSEALKKSVFILPVGNDNYKIGATYQWEWENEEPSEDKKMGLLKSFSEICHLDYEPISHEAGIRPSVKDRRPLLGSAKNNNAIFIFNGLGSRGCFMAPLLAEELIDHIEKGSKLNAEANIERFKQD